MEKPTIGNARLGRLHGRQHRRAQQQQDRDEQDCPAGARERGAEADEGADGQQGGSTEAARSARLVRAPQQGIGTCEHHQRGKDGHQQTLRQGGVGQRPHERRRDTNPQPGHHPPVDAAPPGVAKGARHPTKEERPRARRRGRVESEAPQVHEGWRQQDAAYADASDQRPPPSGHDKHQGESQRHPFVLTHASAPSTPHTRSSRNAPSTQSE